MKQLLNTIDGRKTYIVAIAGIIFGILVLLGVVTADQLTEWANVSRRPIIIVSAALGTIRKLAMFPGLVTGPPAIDGSGEVKTRCRGRILHTWEHPCSYVPRRHALRFDYVEEPYYAMDTLVKLKVDLPPVQVPRVPADAGTIGAGGNCSFAADR